MCTYNQTDGWHLKAYRCYDIPPHSDFQVEANGRDYIQVWDDKDRMYHQLDQTKKYNWTGDNFVDHTESSYKKAHIEALENELGYLKKHHKKHSVDEFSD